MTKEKTIKQTIEISEMYYGMATNSFENAKLLLRKGEISYNEFEEIINNYYQPILTYSSKILIDQNDRIIDEMMKYLDEIFNSMIILNKEFKKLKKSEEIFHGITLLLGSAASTATFVRAPKKTSFSACLSTIKNSIENIESLTSEEVT